VKRINVRSVLGDVRQVADAFLARFVLIMTPLAQALKLAGHEFHPVAFVRRNMVGDGRLHGDPAIEAKSAQGFSHQLRT
jgi:hypothetical protein